MKNLISIFLFLISIFGYSQNIFVPFKVGNLFGISDEKGNLKIAPTFDYINISSEQNNYFLVYKNGKSSCIYKDKVIIKDKNYFGYYPYNDLIVAVEKSSKRTTSYYSHNNEQCHLYSNSGSLIFPDYYMFIRIFEVSEQPITENVLIQLSDMNGKYSIVVYNKKQKKVIQTFLDVVPDLEFSFDAISINQPFTFDYLTNNNINRRITLQYNGKAFSVILDETLPKKDSDFDNYFGSEVAVDMGEDYITKKKNEIQTSKIEVKSIEKVYGAYRKKEFKWVSKWKLPSETSLVFESNKYGIKKYNTNEFLIPIEYDAIYSCDFFGHNYHGYILKKETKYGLYITGFKVKGNGFFIPNIFDNIPLVDQFDYVKKGFHIIGLYDAQGQFLHYANNQGFIYAK